MHARSQKLKFQILNEMLLHDSVVANIQQLMLNCN